MSDSDFIRDTLEFMDSSEARIRELESTIKKLEGRLRLLEEMVFNLWGSKEGRA